MGSSLRILGITEIMVPAPLSSLMVRPLAHFIQLSITRAVFSYCLYYSNLIFSPIPDCLKFPRLFSFLCVVQYPEYISGHSLKKITVFLPGHINNYSFDIPGLYRYRSTYYSFHFIHNRILFSSVNQNRIICGRFWTY